MSEEQTIQLDDSSGSTITSTTDSKEQILAAVQAEAERDEAADDVAESQDSESKRNARRNPHLGGFQKKINKLTRQKYELQQKLRKYEAAEAPQGSAAEQQQVDHEPATDERPIDAREQQNGNEPAPQDQRSEETEKQTRERYDENVNRHPERMAAAKEKYGPEFEEALRSAHPVPSDVPDYIRQLQNGPDVAFFLARRPDLSQRLMGMDPGRIFHEIMELSAFLAGTEKYGNGDHGNKRTRTSAPAPIAPVNGRGSRGEVDIYDENISVSDYLRIRDKQKRGR